MVNVSDVTVYISAYSPGTSGVTADNVVNGEGAGFISQAVLTNAIASTSYAYGSGGGGEPALARGSAARLWAIAVDSADNRSLLRGPVDATTVDDVEPGVTGVQMQQAAGTHRFQTAAGLVRENATNAVNLWLVMGSSALDLQADIQAINGGDLDAVLEPESVAAMAHPGYFADVALPSMSATRFYTSGVGFADIDDTTPDLYAHIVAKDESNNASVAVLGPIRVVPASIQITVTPSISLDVYGAIDGVYLDAASTDDESIASVHVLVENRDVAGGPPSRVASDVVQDGESYTLSTLPLVKFEALPETDTFAHVVALDVLGNPTAVRDVFIPELAITLPAGAGTDAFGYPVVFAQDIGVGDGVYSITNIEDVLAETYDTFAGAPASGTAYVLLYAGDEDLPTSGEAALSNALAEGYTYASGPLQ
eukprot:jgi/Tetstr1/465051/TSEL_009779.t1